MYIEETDSTNNLLKKHPEWITIRTDFQTSGRGQQGNGWESERGKNLLFSTLLYRPPVAIEEQFLLSMVVAVALRDAVVQQIGDGYDICIKWPNDLYAGDKKLAGILIENTINQTGIEQSIIGIGLNINQTQWVGNAPNPTSLKILTGHDMEIEPILQIFLRNLSELMHQPGHCKEEYMKHLYRKHGFWSWEEREVNMTPTMNQTASTEHSFTARIQGVNEQGELLLETLVGEVRRYHFKQIRYIIN